MANDSFGNMLKVLHAKKKKCGCANKFILTTLKLHKMSRFISRRNEFTSLDAVPNRILTPKDVKPLKTTNWFLRGLWVIPVDLKEFLNRYLGERDKLRPLDKLV